MIFPIIEFVVLNNRTIRVDFYCITTGEAYRGTNHAGECIINGEHYTFKAGCTYRSKNLMFSKVVEETSKIKAKFIYYAGGWAGTIATKAIFEWRRN